jgi:hypothetical protein
MKQARQEPLIGSGKRANGLAGKRCFLCCQCRWLHNTTVDTATEEQCFLCGPCLDIISRTISKCSADQFSWVKCRKVKSWLVSE